MNCFYLYHNALRGDRTLLQRVRWWLRFRSPQFVANLMKVTVVMSLVACFLSFFNHI